MSNQTQNKDKEFEKAIKDLTNLNIELVQKDAANKFYKMWMKGKAKAIKDEIRFLKFIRKKYILDRGVKRQMGKRITKLQKETA